MNAGCLFVNSIRIDTMNKRGDTILNDIPLGRFGTPQVCARQV
jgi:hypothetical protein